MLMRVAFVLVLAVHGLIHLAGFVQGFGLADVEALRLSIGRTAGVLWLLAALGFLASAVMFSAAPARWWIVGAPTLLLSQALIVAFWSDAKYGVIPNVIVLVPLILGMFEAGPGSFRSMYERESARHLALLPGPASRVTESDLEPLPPLIQTWLRRAGVVGRPRVPGFRACFHGRFRNGVGSPWMDFTSEQHNFVDPSARLFFMRASLYGIPVDGYHDFAGDDARFRIRVLSLVDVVDGRGPTMNQSETVTIFNDLCVMAPGALVDIPVRWVTLDERSVRGVFARGHQTIAAVLVFDSQGDLVDFVSDDRFYSTDGKTSQRLTWSTPVRGHRDFGGVRLPARVDATWKMPQGDFVYGEFNLDEIEYFGGAPTAFGSSGG
jgi:hypothetical protein